MASSKIKGIIIEIGGNTTKLQEALKGVDKQVYSLNADLKGLNQALKLDPSNINLLAQKQDVLKRNIEATKERLDTLKEAQRQMGSYNHLTDEQKESYNALSVEIAKAETALKGMKNELQVLPGISVENLKNGLKQVGEIALDVSKKVMQISAAVGTALAGVITAGVKSYAKLEQAQKGSERLFGDSFNIVKKNASEAYKTMGLSATEYYDQINTYAVGLKNALGGNTERAAELANSVLKAQADIVSATGANVETVQNAFSAVMRGNYSLLDNLRVGIKGSKEGMQEVINKVNAWNKAQGKATNYQMGNYADMQQALVDYVEMVGIAGTASQQMSSTITGSLSQMKAAFDNFINGSGTASDLVNTIKTFLKNIFKAIKKIAPDLVKGLVELFKDLIPELMKSINEVLPILIEGVKKLIDGVIDFIDNDSEQFITMAVDILTNLAEFILKNLPKILEVGIKILAQLASGIAKALPTLIPTIVDVIEKICETIIDNLDLIIDAAFDIIDGLVEGLARSLPKILEAGIKLTIKLAEGLIEAIPKLIQRIPEIIDAICDGLERGLTDIEEVGGNLMKGLWDGMYRTKETLKIKVRNMAHDVIGWFKGIFGIHSPSTVMRDEIGENLGLGIAEGINDTVGQVESAMSNLSSKVEASVNPVINPTANSNPIYITIENFNNNRETDVQQLAEELEFYRKNSALAKGGV